MNLDDPKLTAYALGELEEPERSELEEKLRDDPAAIEAVAALRTFTAQLRAELHEEKMPGLTAAQRAEILSAAREAAAAGLDGHGAAAITLPAEEPARPLASPWRFWIPAALAAGFAIATTIGLNEPKEEAKMSFANPAKVRQSPAPQSEVAFQEAAAPDNAPRWTVAPPNQAGAESETRREAKVEQTDLAAAPADSYGRSAMAKRAISPEGKALGLQKNVVRVPSPAPGPAGPPLLARFQSAHATPEEPAGSTAKPLDTPAAAPAISTPMDAEDAVAQSAVAPRSKALGDVVQRQAGPVAPGKVAGASAPSPRAAGALAADAKDGAPSFGLSAPLSTPPSANALNEKGAASPAAKPMVRANVEPKDSEAASVPVALASIASLPPPRSLARDQRARTLSITLSDSSARNEEGEGLGRPSSGAALPPPAAALASDSPNRVLEGLSSGAGTLAGTAGGAGRKTTENPFIPVREHALETFPIELEAGSYAEVRGFLSTNQRPPADQVRISELINEFSYRETSHSGNDPIAVAMEVASCPWASGHRLLRVALQGRETAPGKHLPVNLVLMVDVTGKPAQSPALPAVKESLRDLVEELGPEDTVGITANSTITNQPAPVAALAAGAGGNNTDALKTREVLAAPSAANRTILESTNDKAQVLSALDGIQSAETTSQTTISYSNQLQLSYALARRHYIRGGVNQIIFATDETSAPREPAAQTAKLDAMPPAAPAPRDIALRVINLDPGSPTAFDTRAFALPGALGEGFEQTAPSNPPESLGFDRLSSGINLWGDYYFAPDAPADQHALTARLSQDLVIVAREVKLQIEFNSALVGSYRLIGAETRPAADLKSDRKRNPGETPQGGDLGAGQTVTALYELTPRASTPTPPKAPSTIVAANRGGAQKDGSLNKSIGELGKAETPENRHASGGRQVPQPPLPPANLLTLQLRWRAPASDQPAQSPQITQIAGTAPPALDEARALPLIDPGKSWTEASEDFRWSAAVASFGLLLRDSPYKGDATWNGTLQLAIGAKGPDLDGERQDFIGLVEKAKAAFGGK